MMKHHNKWLVKMKLADLHSEIQTSILDYLSIHPEASASVQRVTTTWLVNERSSHSLEQVQTALDRLVERGELKRRLDSNVYMK